MSKELHYDDSKDLYEGLITENDDGFQSQVAQVFPDFRKEYGYKFAAASDMYEALKAVRQYICSEEHLAIADKALAKAEGK